MLLPALAVGSMPFEQSVGLEAQQQADHKPAANQNKQKWDTAHFCFQSL